MKEARRADRKYNMSYRQPDLASIDGIRSFLFVWFIFWNSISSNIFLDILIDLLLYRSFIWFGIILVI